MEIRILGRDLEVSEIGFGCMGMSHAYGTVSTQKEAEELIEKAIDEGCTFFDTAEIYGTTEDPHHNEKLLGEVLRPYRNKIVLASKCGMTYMPFSTTSRKFLPVAQSHLTWHPVIQDIFSPLLNPFSTFYIIFFEIAF